MSDLLQFWNLAERPFEAPWDTRFFYRSVQHAEALNRLQYVVDEGSLNIGMLTGEIGSGKTMTRAVLEDHLPTAEIEVVTLENSGFDTMELLETLIRRLDEGGHECPSGKMARVERLREIIGQLAMMGRHVLILLDEAQDMTQETLRELRWLTNFNGGGRSLVTLILLGQPGLRDLVQSSPAIDQRISLRFHLHPLEPADAPEYLQHRLVVAGHPDGRVFESDAATLIHELSGGIPREMNRLAKLSLEQAWCLDSARVSSEHVSSVAGDISRHQHHDSPLLA